jgi:hypothetical protein
VAGNGSTEVDRSYAHKKSALRCHPLTLDVLVVICFSRSLTELLPVVFDQSLFALWFDQQLFDATEQGCAKIFVYDTIQF